MMLDCKQTSKLLSQALDRKLTLRERFALQWHLLICEYCKQFSQHLKTLRVAIKTMVNTVEQDESIEMPSVAKKRIADLVEAAKQNGAQH